MLGFSFFRRVGAVVLGLFMIAGLGVFTAPVPAQAAPGSSFTDVKDKHAFKLEITWLAEMGVTTGYTSTKGKRTFKPRNNITREAMAAFLYRYSGEPRFTPPKSSPFSDVPTSHTFYKEITWLDKAGVTTGYKDGTFRPKSNITREAMSAFLYRHSKSPKFTAPKKSPFTDVSTKHAFYKEITWLASTGITTGYKKGTEYRPKNRITREATSAFLFRHHAQFTQWKNVPLSTFPSFVDSSSGDTFDSGRVFQVPDGTFCAVFPNSFECHLFIPECVSTSTLAGVWAFGDESGMGCTFHPIAFRGPSVLLAHGNRIRNGSASCSQWKDLTTCTLTTAKTTILMKGSDLLATSPYIKPQVF